ncbi:MAG: helix-turn-helix transcriptional regulator [Clostridia bacterium]|nr:helix-turn-helix transcriptional regulator [Clostridia bacterium]
MPVDLNSLILNTIKNDSKYGLEIIEEIKDKTNGEIVLKQPSLYGALRRLEARGLVTSFWKDSDLGGKRHYYKATEQGLNELENNIKTKDASISYLSNNNESQEYAFSPIKTNSINTVKNVDEDDDDFEPLTAFGSKPSSETKKDSNSIKSPDSSYLEDLEKLFGNSTNTKKSNKEIESNKINSYSSLNQDSSFELLEKISERYNKKHKVIKDEPSAEVSSPVEKKKKELVSINREEEVKTYLYINKINLVSGICLFVINLAILLTVFIFYYVKNWMNLEKYIILGSTLFLSVVITLINIITYYKFPSKKISYKYNWFKSFIARFFITLLLFVAIVAINLLVGMENLNQLTNMVYFIRWFVPSVIVLNILLRWIVNLFLSSFSYFQIEKTKKSKKERR